MQKRRGKADEHSESEEDVVRDPIPPERWIIVEPWDYGDMREGAASKYVDPPEERRGAQRD